MSLNSTNRKDTIERLKKEVFDLLVVGGGITGAGIALDAASRGLKTALVDMQDYAEGTSSRSTKLIHGGLRYLKQMEFGLVREVGKERNILHQNAPHLARPTKMLLPIVAKGAYNKWMTSFGLFLYDRLAGVKSSERRTMLNREETLKKEPLLRKHGLRGGGWYTEYRTDDARLTIEVLKTAVGFGAECINHAGVYELLYDAEGKVNGATCWDHLDHVEFSIRAKMVVNATGPWADELRKKDHSLHGKHQRHTKGVHIVFPMAKLPVKQAMYFDAHDERMVFIIPRKPYVYVGTTDTDYFDDLAYPDVRIGDAQYLINAVNNMLELNLEISDISSSFAGIRPLIAEEGKAPSEVSRKEEIFESHSGLVTIAGGKLTGYRKMAEKTTNLVMRRLGHYLGSVRCRTDKITLSGGQIEGENGILALEKEIVSEYNIEAKEAEWLVGLYGSNVRDVLQSLKGENITHESIILACLEYAVRNEGAVTIDDFFTRRTSLLYFGREWIAPVRNVVEQRLEEITGRKPDIDDKFERAYQKALRPHK